MVKLGNMARLIRHLIPMVYQQYRVSLKKLSQTLNRYEHWRKEEEFIQMGNFTPNLDFFNHNLTEWLIEGIKPCVARLRQLAE